MTLYCGDLNLCFWVYECHFSQSHCVCFFVPGFLILKIIHLQVGVSPDAHHPHTVSIFLWDSCLVPGASTTQTLQSASGHGVREREPALKTETEREGRRRRDGNRTKLHPGGARQTDRSGREAWGLFSLRKKHSNYACIISKSAGVVEVSANA